MIEFIRMGLMLEVANAIWSYINKKKLEQSSVVKPVTCE